VHSAVTTTPWELTFTFSLSDRPKIGRRKPDPHDRRVRHPRPVLQRGRRPQEDQIARSETYGRASPASRQAEGKAAVDDDGTVSVDEPSDDSEPVVQPR
jgi:hypothetical protein